MYLKFIGENGEVIRYVEIKKRIIIGKVRDFSVFSDKRIIIAVDKKHSTDITEEIRLLYDIFMNDFKANYFNFESVYNNASMYVAFPQQKSSNLLILFGSVFLDIKTRQFYSIGIINGNVLLQNSAPVEKPYFYDTS